MAQRPAAGLTIDSSGNLFGTTSGGGPGGYGTVFEIAHGDTAITTIASFNYFNGELPAAGLTIDSSGNLFGTTSGGPGGYGTVFEIAHGDTTIATIASFTNVNGADPRAGLIFDSSGNLFGTTSSGGPGGYGTVFEIAPGATVLTTIASFNITNGAGPVAGLALDSSGNLFGTTKGGGDGTVFEIARGATGITTLANFNFINGFDPEAGLVFDSSGNLFGTTVQGGTSFGTVFEIAHGTTSLSTLVSFNGGNGANPRAGLVLDSSGNLFGTTASGGASGNGVVFASPPAAHGCLHHAPYVDDPRRRHQRRHRRAGRHRLSLGKPLHRGFLLTHDSHSHRRHVCRGRQHCIGASLQRRGHVLQSCHQHGGELHAHCSRLPSTAALPASAFTVSIGPPIKLAFPYQTVAHRQGRPSRLRSMWKTSMGMSFLATRPSSHSPFGAGAFASVGSASRFMPLTASPASTISSSTRPAATR